MNRRRAALRSGLALAVGAALVYALAWAVPLPERLSVGGSPVVAWRDGTAAHVFLAADERWRIPVTVDDVDPEFQTALLAFEDRRFAMHPGIDPFAILRAAMGNLRAGQVTSGASTITLQLVRVLEPRPRTFGSKLVEALRAVQLELRLSKNEILSAYLTFAPYGGNVEGVEAASLAYFGHSSRSLSPAEIATLLAVPQDPNARKPRPDHVLPLRAARDRIAARLARAGALPLGTPPVPVEQALSTVVAARVPDRMRPMPRHAPHAAHWLRASPGAGPRVATTLDAGVQALAERMFVPVREPLAARGIFNGSVVVIEHDSGEVRALVGNFDFFDPDHGGQIAGFNVPRSPGSALKPFVYTAAIDHGLALPEQLVPDVPTSFGRYRPENFDRTWRGAVTLETALSMSLNVPFVDLLGRVGVEAFLGDLRTLGATGLDPRPGRYGLAVAVGGIEVSPLEMAGLYASLAEGGRPRPPRVLASDTPRSEVEVWSPAATYLTRRALTIRDRPDFPSRRQLTGVPGRLHWKTGTSYGFRDAWALGSGPRYTVAVWLGNFDRRGSVHLVGADTAGPILFDVLEALEPPAPLNDPRPSELVEVQVCALSGHLPDTACPTTRGVLAVRTAVPTTRCPYHERVEVDVSTGERVTPACRTGRTTETRTHVHWPPTVQRWLVDQSMMGDIAPPYASGCLPPERTPPRIRSPVAGEIRVLLPGLAADRQEVPFEADSGSVRLDWFVDGAWVGQSSPAERHWWVPAPGVHEVVVVDEAGLASRARLEVRSER